MRNFNLNIAYDGASFHACQIQPVLPTIQGRHRWRRIPDHPGENQKLPQPGIFMRQRGVAGLGPSAI